MSIRRRISPGSLGGGGRRLPGSRGFGRFRITARVFRDGSLPVAGEGRAQRNDPTHQIPLPGPPFVQGRQLVPGLRNPVLEIGDPLVGIEIVRDQIPLDGVALDPEPRDPAFRVVHHRWLGALTQLDPRRGRVEHIDRLVGQLSSGDIPGREVDRGADRVVADVDTVRRLVDSLNATHDGDRVLRRGLVELDQLEAAGEGGILLEVLLVFRPGRRGDGAELPARQRRLQEVGGVAAPGCTAGTDEGVRFVDEEDDRFRRRLDLVDHAAQPVLELSLDAGAGLEESEIEAQQLDMLHEFRYVALDDLECQPFDHGRLAHPRLADGDRVVLAPPSQDVDHQPDLAIAREDRIDPAGPRLLGDVDAEPADRAVLAESRRRAGGAVAVARPPERHGGRLLLRTGDDIRQPAPQLLDVDVVQRIHVTASAEP